MNKYQNTDMEGFVPAFQAISSLSKKQNQRNEPLLGGYTATTELRSNIAEFSKADLLMPTLSW